MRFAHPAPALALGSLRVFGLQTRHWRVCFTPSLSRSSTLHARAKNKNTPPQLGAALVLMVEVRRVELLSTTAHREVSSGLVAFLGGVWLGKRQTVQTPAGPGLFRGMPAASAAAIP